MPVNWRDHIVSDADVLRGRPHITGTRIPVSLILGYLAMGANPSKIREEFRDLSDENIAACLDFARDLAEYEVATT